MSGIVCLCRKVLITLGVQPSGGDPNDDFVGRRFSPPFVFSSAAKMAALQ
jgi:hypothetical protein